MYITALVVDHDDAARVRLRGFLTEETGIHILGDCSTAQQAVAAIAKHAPDLVFLDLHLPDNGSLSMPQLRRGRSRIIFTSTDESQALKAFEARALDYLIKPFSRERFHSAMERVRDDIAVNPTRPPAAKSAIKQLSPRRDYVQRLVFKSKGRIHFIPVAEIRYVTAEGNYLRIHLRGETHLIRETMAGLEARLDPQSFLRIHRSSIVNLRCMKEVHPGSSDGESLVLLEDGTRLALSRGYRGRIVDLAKKGFAGNFLAEAL